ncbi:MAG: hypothetical protein RLZZ330_678 [Actinomycetota bacterium]|jgi:DNA repair protein RecN (Recombination protein N)
MLESLRIRDLGLIKEAEIDFKSGFVAITGETGAGKTLLLDAVRILRGEKPNVVGIQPSDVTVDAAISIATDELIDHITEIGVQLEDKMLLVSRTFPHSGRSKTVLGGRPFPSSVLEDISEKWLAIHGQHDSLRLLKPQTHRELLDSFGDSHHKSVLVNFSKAYAIWRQTVLELTKVEKSRKQLLADAENIKADLAIFDSLAIREGIVEEISQTVERVGRKEEFRFALETALVAIQNEEFPVNSALRNAKSALDKLKNDTEMARMASKIAELSSELGILESDLQGQLTILDSEDEDLDSLMMKQRQIKSLLLRHGPEESDLLTWSQTARRQLALIDPDGVELKALQEQVKKNETEARKVSALLSDSRKEIAQAFEKAVTTEIRELAMPNATFAVDITPIEISETGQDKIEFVFSANPGLKMQSVANAASGGELSRVMLALEVVLMSSSSPSVLIFDEVDAGVAGAAAITVGKKLQKLSQHSQVLVVTHLPQIAAFADQHIHVSKSTDGFVTQTSISTLQQEERITELSRMLAGLEGSESATAHAQELLAMTMAHKSEKPTESLF